MNIDGMSEEIGRSLMRLRVYVNVYLGDELIKRVTQDPEIVDTSLYFSRRKSGRGWRADFLYYEKRPEPRMAGLIVRCGVIDYDGEKSMKVARGKDSYLCDVGKIYNRAVLPLAVLLEERGADICSPEFSWLAHYSLKNWERRSRGDLGAF